MVHTFQWGMVEATPCILVPTRDIHTFHGIVKQYADMFGHPIHHAEKVVDSGTFRRRWCVAKGYLTLPVGGTKKSHLICSDAVRNLIWNGRHYYCTVFLHVDWDTLAQIPRAIRANLDWLMLGPTHNQNISNRIEARFAIDLPSDSNDFPHMCYLRDRYTTNTYPWVFRMTQGMAFLLVLDGGQAVKFHLGSSSPQDSQPKQGMSVP
jgi:hypothetical protein